MSDYFSQLLTDIFTYLCRYLTLSEMLYTTSTSNNFLNNAKVLNHSVNFELKNLYGSDNICSLDYIQSIYHRFPKICNVEVNINSSYITSTIITPIQVSELCTFTSIIKLNLFNAQLITLPDSICKLKRLTKLNLGNNKLTTLPKSICRLTKLKTINIAGNELRELPNSIGELTELKTLSLFKNQLISLPNSIGKLTKLKDLLLHCNQLTLLPESIGALTGLTKLFLYNNHLITLPDSISTLNKLTILIIQNNKFTKQQSPIIKKWLTELKYNDCRLITD